MQRFTQFTLAGILATLLVLALVIPSRNLRSHPGPVDEKGWHAAGKTKHTHYDRLPPEARRKAYEAHYRKVRAMEKPEELQARIAELEGRVWALEAMINVLVNNGFQPNKIRQLSPSPVMLSKDEISGWNKAKKHATSRAYFDN